jgi:UPF0042 nucleotide-binding protein
VKRTGKQSGSGGAPAPPRASAESKKASSPAAAQLLIITGLSGSGKGTALRALEDLGFYAVDNMPIGLIPKFADLTRDSSRVSRAALVVDIREGGALKAFPAMFRKLRARFPVRLMFLEADDATLQRRFSETRRPHPLGSQATVGENIAEERRLLAPIRRLADPIIDTSRLNVHELREVITEKFGGQQRANLRINVTSFGFRHGVPVDSDLVFDVRFLPNPNYIPQFKHLTGRNPKVARYIRSFPQTVEFIERISELLVYLIPHYIREGKTYLTISIGCTGGKHRSVMIASEIRKRLAAAGYKAKETHRDMNKG